MLRVWSTCRSIGPSLTATISPFKSTSPGAYECFFTFGNNDLVLIYALHILFLCCFWECHLQQLLYSLFHVSTPLKMSIRNHQITKASASSHSLCMLVLRTLRSDGATSCNVDTIRIPKWDWTNGCFVHSLLMIRLPRRVFILSVPCSKKNYKVLSLKPDGRPFSKWFWKIGAKLWGMGNGYFIKHPFSNDKCSRWFQENHSETMDSVDWDWCFFYASRLPVTRGGTPLLRLLRARPQSLRRAHRSTKARVAASLGCRGPAAGRWWFLAHLWQNDFTMVCWIQLGSS